MSASVRKTSIFLSQRTRHVRRGWIIGLLCSGQLIGGPFAAIASRAGQKTRGAVVVARCRALQLCGGRSTGFVQEMAASWPTPPHERAEPGGWISRGVRAAPPHSSNLGVTVLHLTPDWQSPRPIATMRRTDSWSIGHSVARLR